MSMLQPVRVIRHMTVAAFTCCRNSNIIPTISWLSVTLIWSLFRKDFISVFLEIIIFLLFSAVMMTSLKRPLRPHRSALKSKRKWRSADLVTWSKRKWRSADLVTWSKRKWRSADLLTWSVASVSWSFHYFLLLSRFDLYIWSSWWPAAGNWSLWSEMRTRAPASCSAGSVSSTRTGNRISWWWRRTRASRRSKRPSSRILHQIHTGCTLDLCTKLRSTVD